MGQVDTYGLGQSLRCTAVNETTWRNQVKATAANSVRLMEWNLTSKPERVVRMDKRPTRSAREIIQRRWTNPWRAKFLICPPDQSTETAPMGEAFIRMGLGGSAAGTNQWLHTLSELQALPVASLAVEAEAAMMEQVVGAWVDETVITISNTDEPTIECTGGAPHAFVTGTSLTTSATTSTVVPVTANSAIDFEADTESPVKYGSIISVGSNDNLQVVLVNHAGNAITVDSSITFGSGDVIQPYTPFSEAQAILQAPPVTASNVVMDVGADTGLVFQDAEIRIKNNIKETTTPGKDYTVDFRPQRRAVTGYVTWYGRKSDVKRLTRARQNNLSNMNPPASPGLVFTMTTGTGSVVCSIPRPYFDPDAINWPEIEEGTFRCPYVALTSTLTTVGDEFAMTWS